MTDSPLGSSVPADFNALRTKTRTSKLISPAILRRSNPSLLSGNSSDSSSPAQSDNNNSTPSGNQASGLFIRFGEHSIQGNRGSQEDSTAAIQSVPAELEVDQDKDFAFFGVFDGHGGDKASDFAANKLPAYINESIKKNPEKDLKVALGEAFERIEKEYCQISYETEAKDGTTAVVVVIEGNRLVAGNVGDSELVFGKGGKAFAPFLVHNPKRNKYEEERVRKEGGIIIHGRVGHPNLNPQFFSIAVSRAIGDIFFKHPEFTGNKPSGLNAQADLAEFQILPETDFALLACDGVWDVLEHQQAIDFVYSQLKQSNDPEKAAKALVAKAYDEGSQDNITVLIVTFKEKIGQSVE